MFIFLTDYGEEPKNDAEPFGGSFGDKAIRRAFIRKVGGCKKDNIWTLLRNSL